MCLLAFTEDKTKKFKKMFKEIMDAACVDVRLHIAGKFLGYGNSKCEYNAKHTHDLSINFLPLDETFMVARLVAVARMRRECFKACTNLNPVIDLSSDTE